MNFNWKYNYKLRLGFLYISIIYLLCKSQTYFFFDNIKNTFKNVLSDYTLHCVDKGIQFKLFETYLKLHTLEHFTRLIIIAISHININVLRNPSFIRYNDNLLTSFYFEML